AGNFLDKYGSGKGINYAVKKLTQVKNDIAITFTQKENQKEFILKNKHSFIEIKKIILNPKFQWAIPDEWSRELLEHNFILTVMCYNSKGGTRQQIYSITGFNNPYYYQPVFTLNNPINIPVSTWDGLPNDNEFPIKIVLDLSSKITDFKFDVMLVYDAALV
ncbi:MAG TPA: hypothetical protein VK766_05560, partial [Cytophagaceae bacterium]|nr:hypothetical protein [Cytophagaceae bacterium]